MTDRPIDSPPGSVTGPVINAPGRADGRMVASVSLDLDNLWSYLKTHGDPAWQSLPTYLPVVVPRLLETYEAFGLTATVFVVGQDAERDENVGALKELGAAGHEIGNHSFHHEPWLHRYSRDQLVEELARTEELLEETTGQRPVGFRGPGYSISPDLVEVLAERGYLYDASTLPTWIGPLARAYYFRSTELDPSQREERQYLFGEARDGLQGVKPYRWTSPAGDLLELPVTTFPGLRVPMHVSYVLYLHAISPSVARSYFRSALRSCRLAGFGPSVLLHPLDLLDAGDAPGVGFFPGMQIPAVEKIAVVRWCLRELTTRFRVVGTAEHARALAGRALPARHPGTA